MKAEEQRRITEHETTVKVLSSRARDYVSEGVPAGPFDPLLPCPELVAPVSR